MLLTERQSWSASDDGNSFLYNRGNAHHTHLSGANLELKGLVALHTGVKLSAVRQLACRVVVGRVQAA